VSQSEWGQSGPVEIYADSQWDPMQGWEQETHYRGYPADIVALGNAFIAAGWRARTESTNSQWAKLIVSIPNDGAEEYIDRWEFNIDFKAQDLFRNIGILTYLKTASFTDDQILTFKTQLETYRDQKTPIAAVTTALGANVGAVYQMMVMGMDSIEVAQPTIARKRTYDISFTGTLMSTQVAQYVFSTSALIGNFAIPDDVANQIATDPSTEALVNTTYGWKLRKNNLVIIPSKNKIEEQVDFVWDIWSTIAYTYIS
jgi:hypothetical protein